MSNKLADIPMGSEWETSSQAIPRFPAKRARATAEHVAIELFEAGVIAMKNAGKEAKEIAYQLGLSESHLSEMRSGKRVVSMHRVVLMTQVDEDAALAVLTEWSRLVGMVPPRLPVKLTKPEAEKKVARKVRKVIGLWEMVRRQIAAEDGLREEDLDRAFDEDTGVHAIGGR